MKKIARFFIGVKSEMAKVRWPIKNEMVKYSIATVAFVILFCAIFSVTDIVIAGLRTIV